ncbi:MAG: flagellar biosynthesis protein FlhB [Sedimentisphaerales bacterium]|nr:flagellar biosynthesis protein FlhB [Sedimentisphaerales bacterium]
MAEKPAAERTEQPTPRRLSKAREKGQAPQSQDLSSAITLLALLLTLMLVAPGFFQWSRSKIESGMSTPADTFANAQTFMAYLNARVTESIVVMLPLLAAISAAGIVTSYVVGGVTYAPGAVQFKWNAINPATVMQNMFSKRAAVRLVSSIAKLLFVGLIVWIYLRDKLDALATLRWAWSTDIITAIARIVSGLGIRVCIAILALGIADAFYQKWQHIEDLKMTRQEVKEEHKDSEGSPEVKSRIRRIQIQMSMKRLSREVPKANVILVNPTHVAVALRYDAKMMDAPILVAKGADHLAQKIIKIGQSYGIPIVRRPEVARAIYASVRPGQTIPEAFYVAVAEVLAMLYRLRQKKRATQR